MQELTSRYFHSLISFTCMLWNSHPCYAFLSAYDLNAVKRGVSRHILNRNSLCFWPLLSFFLRAVTMCIFSLLFSLCLSSFLCCNKSKMIEVSRMASPCETSWCNLMGKSKGVIDFDFKGFSFLETWNSSAEMDTSRERVNGGKALPYRREVS